MTGNPFRTLLLFVPGGGGGGVARPGAAGGVGGVARRGGGQAEPAPNRCLRGRRGSKVKGGRSPSRSDAEGALDFGGAAPYTSATPPPEHPSRPSPNTPNTPQSSPKAFYAPNAPNTLEDDPTPPAGVASCSANHLTMAA